MRASFRWQLRSRSLDLGTRTLIMGVINVTPDSFSDGGKFLDTDRAIGHALQMLDDRADMLDIGGESTRPGTSVLADGPDRKPAVSEEEELRRVMPVIQGVLRSRPDAVISIDTYKSGVARRAIDAGAEVVNDVSAFQWDGSMARTCAELRSGVVLMHTRGRPRDWRNQPPAADMTKLVADDLADRVRTAIDGGVDRERIVLDPGFGFGKNFEENYPLLAHFNQLQKLGYPLLTGTSRKSFIGRSIGRRRGGEDAPPDQRLFGSLAAMVASILFGAHIVRVHEVKSAVDAAAIADAVLAVESNP